MFSRQIVHDFIFGLVLGSYRLLFDINQSLSFLPKNPVFFDQRNLILKLFLQRDFYLQNGQTNLILKVHLKLYLQLQNGQKKIILSFFLKRVFKLQNRERNLILKIHLKLYLELQNGQRNLILFCSQTGL